MRIGRLDRGPAANAVRVPLQERGRSIEERALRQVVCESHAYPFFLQIWEDLPWKGCTDSFRPVSCADVDRERPLFKDRRAVLYRELLAELRAADLVSVAARVAAEFVDPHQVLPERVTTAVRASLRQQGEASDGETALKVVRVLRHLGYVWSVVNQGIEY